MRFFLFFVLGLLFVTPTFAFRLSPMVVEFLPAGDGATQTFVLENNDAKRTAVELEVTTRAVALDGKETREATKDFLVFPPQLSLEPGEKRNVRVTYVGEQKLDGEKAYRLVASQLQVDFQKPKQNPGASVAVNFLLQYVASLYVGPDSAKARIQVDKPKALKSGNTEFVVRNTGTRHQLLTEGKLRFSSRDKGGKRKEWIPAQELTKDILSENILAGSARRFQIKIPAEFSTEELKADISF